MNRTLLIVLLFGWTRLAAGQDLVQSARTLPPLSPGAAVDVVQADRQIVPGRVVSVSPSSLVVQTADGVHQFPVGEVAEIWRFERHSPWKPLLIGSAVTVALMGMAQAGQGDCRDPKSPCATDGPVTGGDYVAAAAFGAGVGAAISLIGRRRALIYSVDNAEGEAVPAAGETGPPPAEWVAMTSAVGPGARVAVDVAKRRFEGLVVSVADSTMTLRMEGRTYVIARQAIRRVTRPAEMSRWWVLGAPAVGAVHGAVLGVLFTLPYCLTRDEDDAQDRCAGTTAGIGSGIGAVLYGVLAWRATRSRVLYDVSATHRTPSNSVVEPIITRGGAGIRYLRRF